MIIKNFFLYTLLTLSLTSCSFSLKPTPSMIYGLPSDESIASQIFTERLNEKYPAGIQESKIIESLHKEGFDLVKPGYANLERAGFFPCMKRWQVNWKTDSHGIVQNLKGSYGTICL